MVQRLQKAVVATLLPLAFLGVAILSLTLVQTVRAESNPSYWRMLVHLVGSDATHEIALRIIKDLPRAEGHITAHIFGGALYEEQGPEQAMMVCNGMHQPDYGCLHEVMGRYTFQNGVEAVPELAKVCSRLSNPSLCRHGIGHGLVLTFGYAPKDLEQALAVCKTIGESDMDTDCSSGAFMEYNMRVVLNGDIRHLRPLDDPPWHLCTLIGKEFEQICVRTLPSWWNQIIPNSADKESTFATMVEWCRASEIRTWRQDCLTRIGITVGNAFLHSPEKAEEMCRKIRVEEEEEAFCRAGLEIHERMLGEEI